MSKSMLTKQNEAECLFNLAVKYGMSPVQSMLYLNFAMKHLDELIQIRDGKVDQ